MMTTLRALVIAFSMYSQIPMPQFTWQDKEMKYAFCFFPWVGAAIGGITMFWWWFCGKFSVGNVAFAMIGTAIPLAVTGGFQKIYQQRTLLKMSLTAAMSFMRRSPVMIQPCLL